MPSLPKAPFGRTGHMSTRALFGAAALGNVSQDEADRAIALYTKYGGNHIDTAASYGQAELRLGPWLKHNRKSVFLATKTEERTYAGAKEELKRSLERMQVDSVDMWQMHVLIREEEWRTAMGPGGALEAFIEAREKGLVKWLGVTGHGLGAADIHLKSLERFDFDSVLLAWNWTISRHVPYAESFRKLHELCMERNLPLQMIKTGLHRPWREGEERTRATWYKPFEAQSDFDASIHWSMQVEGSFINTTGDVGLLEKVLKAVASYDGPPSDEEIRARAEAGEWESLFPED